MADIQFRTDVRVEIFPDVVNRLVDSPGGPVGRLIQHTCEVLLQSARTRVGDQYSGTTGRPTEVRPGRLKDSGEVRSIGGANHSVVFNHPIAFMHHEGSQPHPIGGEKQKLGNKNYPNTRAGHPKYPNRLFFAYGPVDHPGHAGNPFLTDAAAELGLRASGELRRGTEQVPLFRSKSFF